MYSFGVPNFEPYPPAICIHLPHKAIFPHDLRLEFLQRLMPFLQTKNVVPVGGKK